MKFRSILITVLIILFMSILVSCNDQDESKAHVTDQEETSEDKTPDENKLVETDEPEDIAAKWDDKTNEERVAILEEKVAALFNADQTDLAEEISDEQINEIEQLIDANVGEDFSEDENMRQTEAMYYFHTATLMIDFQNDVLELFEEQDDRVKENVLLADVESLINELRAFDKETTFQERNQAKLKMAEEQLKQ